MELSQCKHQSQKVSAPLALFTRDFFVHNGNCAVLSVVLVSIGFNWIGVLVVICE